MATVPRGGIGLEIGVQAGNFTADILAAARPKVLHAVDCWRHIRDGPYASDSANVEDAEQDALYATVLRRFWADIAVGRFIAYRILSADAFDLFPPAFFDWAYIDADHSRAGALADLSGCLRVVRPGGWIMGHDYQRRSYFGVIEAVGDFLGGTGLSLSVLTMDRDPSFGIRLPT